MDLVCHVFWLSFRERFDIHKSDTEEKMSGKTVDTTNIFKEFGGANFQPELEAFNKCKGYDTFTYRTAKLINKGLNRKACCFVSLTELPFTVFNCIGKEEEHKQLNECLSKEESKTCKNDKWKPFE